MKTKMCKWCGIEKPLDELVKSKQYKDGYRPYCKQCTNTRNKETWTDPEKRTTAMQQRKGYKLERAKQMHDYLTAHPCVDCGETDPIVLEFDHVRDVKIADVAFLYANGYSWEKVEAEIAKCDVRCANCHRRVTAKRGNWMLWQHQSTLGR